MLKKNSFLAEGKKTASTNMTLCLCPCVSEVRGKEAEGRKQEAGKRPRGGGGERDTDGFPCQEVLVTLVFLKAEARLGGAKV